MSADDGILVFDQQAFRALSEPRGTARVISSGPPSGMEMALLRYFRKHPRRTLSREELAEQVWRQRHFHGSRTIDQTVAKLRKKLRRGDGKILSVWSAGYRFETDGEGHLKKSKAAGKRP